MLHIDNCLIDRLCANTLHRMTGCLLPLLMLHECIRQCCIQYRMLKQCLKITPMLSQSLSENVPFPLQKLLGFKESLNLPETFNRFNRNGLVKQTKQFA